MSKSKNPSKGNKLELETMAEGVSKSELSKSEDTQNEKINNKENNDFSKFNLSKMLINKLTLLSFTNPTKIQNDVIPLSIEGHDILASSRTGSGKTLAFSIPSIQKMLTFKEEGKHGQILILTPTREIASQVAKVIESTGKDLGIFYSLLIGGDNMFKQLDQLKRKPQVIIGTPGRVNDHLDRKSIKLADIETVVLDEADKMLDMGFDVQIDGIMSGVKQECQILMFSATLSKRIEGLSKKYLKNPKIILNVEHDKSENDIKNIKQEFAYHSGFVNKKDDLIKSITDEHEGIIVFVKTKSKTEEIADLLDELGHAVDCLHGDLKQSVRSKVISKFRDKKFKILIATDVAARGLDISHISLVINFDMPMCFEDYIHRIGRTNRESGATGRILNFVSPIDNRMANEIRAKLGHAVKPMKEEGRSSRGGFGRGNFGGGRSGGSRFGERSGGSRFGSSNGERSGERSSGKFGGFGDKNRSGGGSSRFGERSGGSRFGSSNGERGGSSFSGDFKRKKYDK